MPSTTIMQTHKGFLCSFIHYICAVQSHFYDITSLLPQVEGPQILKWHWHCTDDGSFQDNEMLVLRLNVLNSLKIGRLAKCTIFDHTDWKKILD